MGAARFVADKPPTSARPLDFWLAYFKVAGSDKIKYILRHDAVAERRDLVMLERPRKRSYAMILLRFGGPRE
jgi:hypothetical protein